MGNGFVGAIVEGFRQFSLHTLVFMLTQTELYSDGMDLLFTKPNARADALIFDFGEKSMIFMYIHTQRPNDKACIFSSDTRSR